MKSIFSYLLPLAALVLVGCSAGRNPSSAAKHFYTSIAEGEYAQALAATTISEDIDPEIYYAIMDKVNHSIAERGGVESIDVESEITSEDGLSAVVKSRITYANGTSQIEECDVILQEKVWRVDVNLDSK